jgi:NAD(P)-dependent dehydrogenase (short-subunit alcohol dehydrogenase family)
MKLGGRVALITGAGGAIGSAQARLLAAEGARVCVSDLNRAAARAVADEITAAGGSAIAAELDVRRAADWARAVAAVEAAFEPLSILCNVAGANVRVGFDAQTEEMWRLIVDTILTGSFLGIKAVVPSMRRAGGGVIVNLGSLASVRSDVSSPAYVAAKTGLVGLTRVTAAAYASSSIRCVIVVPGHVDTPFIRASTPHSPNDATTSIDVPENYERRLRDTPLGRLQVPDDVARAVLFAVSDDASMITGSTITVDGGTLC